MRTLILCGALSLAACGPDDAGRDATTAAPTTAGSTGTTVDGATTDVATTGAAPTTTATTGETTGSTTADASAGTTTGAPTDTTVADTTAVGSSTGADTAGPSCPPEGEQDCSPGPGSGEGDTCVFIEPCFRTTVQDAIKQVLADHPEWFMHDDMGDLVLEVELYMNTVVEQVNVAGLCAIRDPNAGDEIAVKHDNEYAENFDILTAAGYVRYGDGIYTSTCIPAWF